MFTAWLKIIAWIYCLTSFSPIWLTSRRKLGTLCFWNKVDPGTRKQNSDDFGIAFPDSKLAGDMIQKKFGYLISHPMGDRSSVGWGAGWQQQQHTQTLQHTLTRTHTHTLKPLRFLTFSLRFHLSNTRGPQTTTTNTHPQTTTTNTQKLFCNSRTTMANPSPAHSHSHSHTHTPLAEHFPAALTFQPPMYVYV